VDDFLENNFIYCHHKNAKHILQKEKEKEKEKKKSIPSTHLLGG
jgi:hypothetical protein